MTPEEGSKNIEMWDGAEWRVIGTVTKLSPDVAGFLDSVEGDGREDRASPPDPDKK